MATMAPPPTPSARPEGADWGMPEPDPVITCIDCGGRAHLLTWRGDLASYRCEDCLDRWDLVIPELLDESADGDDGRDPW
jgi:hypothetical protein